MKRLNPMVVILRWLPAARRLLLAGWETAR